MKNFFHQGSGTPRPRFTACTRHCGTWLVALRISFDGVDFKSAEAKNTGLQKYSRRNVLSWSGLAVLGATGAAGFGGYAVGSNRATGSASATASAVPSVPVMAAQPGEIRSFQSTPLTVAKFAVARSGETAPGYLFLAPQDEAVAGAVIMDDAGEPVWIQPASSAIMDFRVQQYRGEPVLTYWEGEVVQGHGMAGSGVKVLNPEYSTVSTVDFPQSGFPTDLHETEMADGTSMLLLSYVPVPADTSALGGPVAGWVLDCVVQQIDIASGATLFEWKCLDHLDLAETFVTSGSDGGRDGSSAEKAFCPFHINTLQILDGRLLIGARHTHALYCVDLANGQILWRLNGKRSDFAMGPGAPFAWQHHARWRDGQTLSLFDNASLSDDGTVSRGVLLTVDETAKTAELQKSFSYAGHWGAAEGGMTLLPNGNALVSWGTGEAVTEFTPDGTPVLEISGGGATYRAYRAEWVGRPTTRPAVAVRPWPVAEAGAEPAMEVFASWNGATEVTSWRVLTGGAADSLALAASFRRSGFESSASVPQAGFVQLEALDAAGKVLGSSEVRPFEGS